MVAAMVLLHLFLQIEVQFTEEIPECHMTWRELAELGVITVSGEQKGKINLPSMWVRIHFGRILESSLWKPYFQPFAEFFRLKADEEKSGGAGFWWQSFESFCARYLALRFNFQFRLHTSAASLPLGQLLGVNVPGSVIIKRPQDCIQFDVLGLHQFPSNKAKFINEEGTSLDIESKCFALKNVAGAPCDSFLNLRSAESRIWIFVQSRHSLINAPKDLDYTSLEQEYKKCSKAMHESPWKNEQFFFISLGQCKCDV